MNSRCKQLTSLALVAILLCLSTTGSSEQKVYEATRKLGILEQRGSLNSDKREKIRLLNTGAAASNSFYLLPGESFRLIRTEDFSKNEQIMDTQTQSAFRYMTVNYNCAYVEVLDGPNSKKTGWTLLVREVPGVQIDEYATPQSDKTKTD